MSNLESVKRYALGYALLFGLLLTAAVPCSLPFVATLAVGSGFLAASGEPFPRDLFLPLLLASETLSLAVGLVWFWGPRTALAAGLQRLRSGLLRRGRFRLFMAVAMLLSLPLMASVVSPLSLLLSALAAALGPESSPFFASKVTRIALFAIECLLLGIVLGKPLGQATANSRLGRGIMRAREVFLDWTLSALQPGAVEVERKRLLK